VESDLHFAEKLSSMKDKQRHKDLAAKVRVRVRVRVRVSVKT
jgi:hypothetical protein